jgi:hypothetical protein
MNPAAAQDLNAARALIRSVLDAATTVRPLLAELPPLVRGVNWKGEQGGQFKDEFRASAPALDDMVRELIALDEEIVGLAGQR